MNRSPKIISAFNFKEEKLHHNKRMQSDFGKLRLPQPLMRGVMLLKLIRKFCLFLVIILLPSVALSKSLLTQVTVQNTSNKLVFISVCAHRAQTIESIEACDPECSLKVRVSAKSVDVAEITGLCGREYLHWEITVPKEGLNNMKGVEKIIRGIAFVSITPIEA